MSKLKIIFLIVLCAVFLTVIAGCGKDDNSVIAGNRDDSLYAGNSAAEPDDEGNTAAGGNEYNGK